MKRRTFIKSAAALSVPTFVPSTVFAMGEEPGANDRIRVGIAGLGGRAKWLLLNEGFPGARITAVADCFENRCDEAAGAVANQRPELRPETWNKYPGIRQMLDHEELDAVFVETTTHARVWCIMHALAAGCDVYGEKPLSLTVEEGRLLADAAKKSGRILQTGTQQRSIPINAYLSRLIREGAIGKVNEVIVYNFAGPGAWEPKPAQPIPESLNWDLWCNQVALQPYHPEIHFGWINYEAFDGGGQSWGITGWGTHSFDQVQCALGTDDTGPVEIWLDEEKRLNDWPQVFLRYASGTVLKLVGERHTMEDLGAIFRGEQGNIEILRGHARANPPELLDDAPADTPNGPQETVPHIQNFLDCVRSREKPAADAETGHRATSICHLINICRQLGRRLQWDPQSEQFVGDEQANTFLSRPRREGYELPEIT